MDFILCFASFSFPIATSASFNFIFCFPNLDQCHSFSFSLSRFSFFMLLYWNASWQKASDVVELFPTPKNHYCAMSFTHCLSKSTCLYVLFSFLADKGNTNLVPIIPSRQGKYLSVQFSSVQSLSRVWLFATPWIAACQASLSIINSQSLLKLMPIEAVMPSSHLILCHPLLLLPPILPRFRVFSNESTLCRR